MTTRIDLQSPMDLLLSPQDPSRPRQNAPYVCTEQWDGGSFFHYALRKDRLRSVPVTLRRFLVEEGSTDVSGGEFLEILYPTPQEELQAFFQTWFFFGLLAEFLGINQVEGVEPAVDADTAARELGSLRDDYTFEENGVRYLTGAKLLEPELGMRVMVRVKAAKPDTTHRISYLHRCLVFTAHMLANGIHTVFDPRVRHSISALGELFSTAMAMGMNLGRLPKTGLVFGFSWSNRYIRSGDATELTMLQNGWCGSEIEKIRYLYQGLGTQHFLSQMRKEEPYRVHSQCPTDGCIAFQLDMGTYRPSHARENCECDMVFVDHAAVDTILKNSHTFPLIRIKHSSNASSDQDFTMEIEKYEPGVPYVAISHVKQSQFILISWGQQPSLAAKKLTLFNSRCGLMGWAIRQTMLSPDARLPECPALSLISKEPSPAPPVNSALVRIASGSILYFVL